MRIRNLIVVAAVLVAQAGCRSAGTRDTRDPVVVIKLERDGKLGRDSVIGNPKPCGMLVVVRVSPVSSTASDTSLISTQAIVCP